MYPAVIVDEAELGQLATLIARLSPAQQLLVTALADGFRAGWLDPLQWERAWRGSDLNDDEVLGDARTWLARRPGRPRNVLVAYPAAADLSRPRPAGRLTRSGGT